MKNNKFSDILSNLYNDLRNTASEYGFNIELSNKILKIIPKWKNNQPILELMFSKHLNKTIIYKHRNIELTREHKGKPVSKKWVINFIETNRQTQNMTYQFKLRKKLINKSNPKLHHDYTIQYKNAPLLSTYNDCIDTSGKILFLLDCNGLSEYSINLVYDLADKETFSDYEKRIIDDIYEAVNER